MEKRTTPIKIYSDERTIHALDLKNLEFVELTTIENCEAVMIGGENTLTKKDLSLEVDGTLSEDFIADLELFTIAAKHSKKILNFHRAALIQLILSRLEIIDKIENASAFRLIDMVDGSSFMMSNRRTNIPYFGNLPSHYKVFATSSHSYNSRYFQGPDRLSPKNGEYEIFANDYTMNFMFPLDISNFKYLKDLIHSFLELKGSIKILSNKFNKSLKQPKNEGVKINPWELQRNDIGIPTNSAFIEVMRELYLGEIESAEPRVRRFDSPTYYENLAPPVPEYISPPLEPPIF